MNETYIQVGREASWIVAFMPVPAIIARKITARKKGLSAKLSWTEVVVVLFFFEGAYLGLPMLWMMYTSCVVATCHMVYDKTITWKAVPRVMAGVAALSVVASPFLLGQNMDPISLDDRELKFEEFRGPRKLLRDGMTVHSYGGPRKLPFEIRTSQQWSFYNGKESGPSIFGSNAYWGPRGLIRGDDLAMRIASWANTVPIVDPLINDDETDTTSEVSVRPSVRQTEGRTEKG